MILKWPAVSMMAVCARVGWKLQYIIEVIRMSSAPVVLSPLPISPALSSYSHPISGRDAFPGPYPPCYPVNVKIGGCRLDLLEVWVG